MITSCCCTSYASQAWLYGSIDFYSSKGIIDEAESTLEKTFTRRSFGQYSEIPSLPTGDGFEQLYSEFPQASVIGIVRISHILKGLLEGNYFREWIC